MTTITIPKKEYKSLYRLKQKLEDILRMAVKRNKITGKDVLEFTKLKIKGGPRNLSEKLDSYLYR